MMSPAHFVYALFYTFAALFFLTLGGNWSLRRLFALTRPDGKVTKQEEKEYRAGRLIGSLERLILAIGIIMQRWDILAAVVALKSVARFKELDNKLPAEYFLIGSLFSILWAIVVTGAWLAFDRMIGLDVNHQVAAFYN